MTDTMSEQERREFLLAVREAVREEMDKKILHCGLDRELHAEQHRVIGEIIESGRAVKRIALKTAVGIVVTLALGIVGVGVRETIVKWR